MKHDYLGVLFGNLIRVKILQALGKVRNEGVSITTLARASSVSLKKVRVELLILKKNGIVTATGKKEKEIWSLNHVHEHVVPLTQFLGSVAPARHNTIATTLKKAGRISAVLLSGLFMNDRTRPVDIIVVADTVPEKKLEKRVRELEGEWGHEIRYAVFSVAEFRYRMTVHDRLLREVLDFPHIIAMDTKKLLS